MSRFLYPCTGQVQTQGFPEFLSKNLGRPRANIQAFSKELGKKFGGGAITLVNSGSSANLSAALTCSQMFKSSLKREAFVAGFTFPTTISALQLAGFTVKVVDTEPGGFNMDPASLQAALKASNADVRVVCFTHFLGFPAQIEKLCHIAQKNDALVIQDACETMDLRVGDRPAHEFGLLTTWSFYHPHHLSSFGGGAVVSRLWPITRLVESTTHWGRKCVCHVEGALCDAPRGMDHNFWYVNLGQNLEMSELNACFGRFQLRSWHLQEKRRKRNYRIMQEALNGLAHATIYPAPENNGSPFVFPITIKQGDVASLAERLQRQHGIETRTLMGGVVSRQPVFKRLRHDGLANARDISERSLFVGIHQTLPERSVKAVATILRKELA